MDAEERRREILETARRAGSVDVDKLAADLGVSKETVRRDLHVLEEHGLVRRTHGGAYPVESAGFETTLAVRTTMHVPRSRRIAAAAAELLGDAETVYIDEGFTPQLIAEALPRDRPLTVVTASLRDGERPRGRREHHRTAARRPGPRRHAGHGRPLGHPHALRLRHRPGVRRRERHLPRVRPHHPRSGGQRGQGAGHASARRRCSPACTPNSAR